MICRVNGMRIGGGREIGMACDFSVAQDPALWATGPRSTGSAPIGGATDFLPVVVGAERDGRLHCASRSRHWKATRWASLTDIVPALKVDGKWVASRSSRRNASSTVRPQRYGEPVSSDALLAGKR